MREGPVFGAWVELLARPGMIAILLFILLFKLGDAAMGFMVKPFWVDAGFSNQQIGLVSVNLGLAFSIAGGLLGGWYVDKAGIFRGLGCSACGRRCPTSATPPRRRRCRTAHRVEVALSHQAMVYGRARSSFTGGLGHRRVPRVPDGDHEPASARPPSTRSCPPSSPSSRAVAGWAAASAPRSWLRELLLPTFWLSFPAICCRGCAMLAASESGDGAAFELRRRGGI